MSLRTYGHDKTIHRTEALDVELGPDGKVVAVWFRCQPLPFREARCGEARAEDMRRMYEGGADKIRLSAVVVGTPE